MGRAKVKLERIAKERSRNTTFQKRKKGLKKKMYEFSTLCGVDACLIIFPPNQVDTLVQPETWPENREDVVKIIERFRKHSREEQGKRQIGIPQFFEDQTRKLRSDLVKLRHRNGKAKYPTWDVSINNFSETQLRSFVASLNSKLEQVKLKIDLIERKPVLDDITGSIEYSVPVPPLNQYPPPPPPYWDSSNISILDDMLMHMNNHHQPFSCLKPLDHRHRLSMDYFPSDPSDLMFQTTMVNNSMDCTGDRYGTSRNIVPFHPAAVVAPMHSPIYYNPMLPASDETVVLNNTGGGPLPYYYSANMQQPMMHSYFAQQLHPISEFSDFQDD